MPNFWQLFAMFSLVKDNSADQGVAAKASAVGFCLGCGLFGSYNSL